MKHELAHNVTIYQGDCQDILPTFLENSVDSLVTDPPAGVSFMGKAWDDHTRYIPRSEKGRAVLEACTLMGMQRWEAGFIAFTADWATATLRVLKPGAHGLVWALPRTADLTVSGLRSAGFEILNVVTHIFGSGFPKNLDVSKAIDLYLFTQWLREHRPKARRFTKRLWKCTPKDRLAWRWCQIAEERWGPLTGKRIIVGTKEQRNPYIGSDNLQFQSAPDYGTTEEPITAPGSPEAQQWDGWGTALKPSSEHWILVRKPLAKGTVAENLLEHGTGAINIGGCRVTLAGEEPPKGGGKRDSWRELEGRSDRQDWNGGNITPQEGRWPPNIVFTHHAECQRVGTKRVSVSAPASGPTRNGESTTNTRGKFKGASDSVDRRDEDGMETVEAWDCVEGCPIRLLDEQSGVSQSNVRPPTGRDDRGEPGFVMRRKDTKVRGHADQGGASRFFPAFALDPEDINTALYIYAGKASRAERDAGCEHLPKRSLNWSSGEENPGSFQGEGTDREARNFHPTVKSKALMKWLLRLVTPPGGIPLDPFNGSGSTGKAALEEGMGYIGIEREPGYVEITLARMKNGQLHFNFGD